METQPILARKIQKRIENSLFKGKVIILYGPRQVGKTTLVKKILESYLNDSVYFSCDEPDVRQALTNKTSNALHSFLGNKKLIVLDEAQRVKDVGLTLKLLVDNFPNIQIIATGSSSFELSNKVIEPLTGRNVEFHLYPFSVQELLSVNDQLTVQRILERRLIYGMYPEVIKASGAEEEKAVRSIARDYLYKDILMFQDIKNPEILEKLLQALALQLGNEVSYNELSQLIGVDKNTVSNYIQILEKAFVIFRLPPFARNLRNELKKLRKIYFYDNGIRNALINNFNNVDLRNDVGPLWENFMLSERIKWHQSHNQQPNLFFWRTHSRQEIDLIEEGQGKLTGYEFKWQNQRYQAPQAFQKSYPSTTVSLICQENFLDFLN